MPSNSTWSTVEATNSLKLSNSNEAIDGGNVDTATSAISIRGRFVIGTVLPQDVISGTLHAGEYDSDKEPEGEGQLLAAGRGYATLYVAVNIQGTLEWKKVRIEPLTRSQNAGLPYWST